MKKSLVLKILVSAMILPALFISCTKTGNLGGAGSVSPGGFGSSVKGNVTGGLSPVSGALVNLVLSGTNTSLGSATTGSDGSYNIAYTNPGGSAFFYITVTGGNVGSGTNSKIQLMAMAGTAQSPQTQVAVNELTTASAELIGTDMGLLKDTNGTITFNAASNQAGTNNLNTQTGNLLNVSLGTLNTSNSNLTTATKNSLNTMANAFASCIENSANCGTLLSTATTSAGVVAVNMLESGVNMLGNSSNLASSIYTLAFPLNSTTGFTLPSSNLPSGFSFNSALPVAVRTLPGIVTNTGYLAIDVSGNVWVTNSNSGGTNIVELNSSGSTVGSFTVGTKPDGIAIDAAGNVWVANFTTNNVTELNSSGTTLGTFSVGLGAAGISIDASGNVWVANQNANTLTELNSSGSTLGTFTVGTTPAGVSIDGFGNVWVANEGTNNVTKLNASGLLLGTFSVGNTPVGIAFDQSGNSWIGNNGSGTVTKLNPNGVVLGTFTAASTPFAVAIDQSGNTWVATSATITELSPAGVLLGKISTGGASSFNVGLAFDTQGNLWSGNFAGSVIMISGLSSGPSFFPYSGPQFPHSP